MFGKTTKLDQAVVFEGIEQVDQLQAASLQQGTSRQSGRQSPVNGAGFAGRQRNASDSSCPCAPHPRHGIDARTGATKVEPYAGIVWCATRGWNHLSRHCYQTTPEKVHRNDNRNLEISS